MKPPIPKSTVRGHCVVPTASCIHHYKHGTEIARDTTWWRVLLEDGNNMVDHSCYARYCMGPVFDKCSNFHNFMYTGLPAEVTSWAERGECFDTN